MLLLALMLTALLGRSVWQLSMLEPASDLPRQLQDKLAASGVEHPVTAVLLNFRSYDTLLEIAVLVIAAMAGISMARTRSLEDPELRTSDTLLRALLRWLVPLMLLLAGYLLWAGADRPGGAFQAGAMLAATGVLMRLTGLPLDFLRPGILLRIGLVLGFALFLLVGLASAIAGDVFLAYPREFVKGLILSIETLLTLSIGMILLALFVAAPVNDASEPEEGEK
ncbi:sodium:proton antiporter [Marinobacterium sp. AK62]|uniref:Sodium:proton antiporter n=2 Tax=Marinobacterium alkalitolerans TaxID=1542925 RepID=A0ABS3ZCD6_9GAMM|nr:sodium:proton antiporter [Marinobacterium alkalitolerans]